jgi:hypothetical protein
LNLPPGASIKRPPWLPRLAGCASYSIKRLPFRFAPISKDTRFCTAAQQGWDTFKNGELLTIADADCFDVLLTTDKNMRYQQNLAGRKIAVVVLGLQQWPSLQPHVQLVVEAVNAAMPGSYIEIDLPRSSHPEHGT